MCVIMYQIVTVKKKQIQNSPKTYVQTAKFHYAAFDLWTVLHQPTPTAQPHPICCDLQLITFIKHGALCW